MALTTPERGRVPGSGRSAPPQRSRVRAAVKARTYRVDRWWLPPLVQFLGLSALVAYGTVAAFRNAHYFTEPVPVAVLFPVPDRQVRRPLHAGLPRRLVALLAGLPDPDLPARLPPHLLLLPQGLLPVVLAVPAGLRGAPTPHKRYTGESRFPLLIQNIHRYFFYIASLFAVLLTYDARARSFDLDGHFGIGVGTGVLAINVALITLLHALVPLLPAHHRRPAEVVQQAPDALPLLEVRRAAQRTAHAAGLGQPDLDRRRRPLHLAGRHGTITDYHWVS